MRDNSHRECKESEKLLKAISRNCPKIEGLTVQVELENLDDIREIFKIALSEKNLESLQCISEKKNELAPLFNIILKIVITKISSNVGHK